jgi:hypothetical protein
VIENAFSIRRLADPLDPGLAGLARLLQASFADPDTVLELDRMQAFLTQPPAETNRHFRVLVAKDGGAVVGGSIFSYVPSTNCGFSEYLVVRKQRHGEGLGRRLFDARKTMLNELAREAGQDSCHGLFIEADSPERTPPHLQAREREMAMDAVTRLAVFAHLGFLRVELDYVQPPLGPGKQPVTYLDLLFAPWAERVRAEQRVPAEWVAETLCPVWHGWSPDDATADCKALRQRLAIGWAVQLVRLRC